MQSLDEMLAEDEAKALAKTRAEVAAEDAAYAALPQAEKDRIQAERDAYWDRIAAIEIEGNEEDDEDEDDEDEDDE